MTHLRSQLTIGKHPQSAKMKCPLHFCCSAAIAILTVSLFSSSHATVGGQYSVNVHFVAPLITAPCPIAQFWTPPNVVCGLCFCMTGTLSRCIPQPGCNPSNTTTPSSNTTSTTPPPSNSTMGDNQDPMNNGTMGMENPSAAETPPNNTNPGDSSSSPDNGGNPNPGPAAGESGSSQDPPADTGTDTGTPSKSNKLRGAKPGKSRRRRKATFRN